MTDQEEDLPESPSEADKTREDAVIPSDKDSVAKLESAKTNAESEDVSDDHDDEEDDEEGADSETDSSDETDFEGIADDPLAPAYDLDLGAPLETDEHDAQLPWETKVRSAKEFFNTEVLYRFDILPPEDQEQLKGKYRLELKGEQGGVWTLNLGDDLDVVNRKEDADVVLSMKESDFMNIVNGSLNPQLAILAEKVRVQGDVRRVVLFQNILAPSRE